jgi:aryl-alcohol dehydrogenase-like predicted oxidoreductase
MKIGLGCGALGVPSLDEESVHTLLEGALELGITVFDAARSYGAAEARLGRGLSGRRVTLSTKGGYGVEPVPEWTGAAIFEGIERARQVLGVERIDVFHLHSCPLEVLKRAELTDALHEAKRSGRIARSGYSGDNEALDWAVESGLFDAVQASFSIVDQSNGPTLRRAKERGLWVMAKRPLGGAVWRSLATDEAGREYRRRLEGMRIDVNEDVAARFVAHAPEIDVALVGTTRLENLRQVVGAVAKGPLPGAVDAAFRDAFARSSSGWRAQI